MKTPVEHYGHKTKTIWIDPDSTYSLYLTSTLSSENQVYIITSEQSILNFLEVLFVFPRAVDSKNFRLLDTHKITL